MTKSVSIACLALSLAISIAACAGDDDAVARETQAAQTIAIDPRRSLVVTEEALLAGFPLERVLDQLVVQGGVPGQTALGLFQQWWDTQNPLPPGVAPDPLHPRCGDSVDSQGFALVAGAPYACRPAPAEGVLAGRDPFVDAGTNPDEFIPIGLFNRFDLTPGDGSTCGEHRIVYALRSGIASTTRRNLVIFEFALANPHPQQGLKGCKKVADFWADLSKIDDPEVRAAMLERFYFDGHGAVAPVVHIDHLGAGPTGAGQVRSNQFMQEVAPRVWSLREFKLARTCAGGACTSLRFEPVTVKTNPIGALFAPGAVGPGAATLRAALVEEVPALAGAGIADIGATLPGAIDAAQSQAQLGGENDYVALFAGGGGALATDLATELARLGLGLTPAEIVARAQAMSCAGCHRLSNDMPLGGGLTWPRSQGFTHVSERDPEILADGSKRFAISDALLLHFIPRRKQVLEDYLNSKLKPTKQPKDKIGGNRVH